MELGPNLIALLLRLRKMDPDDLHGLLQAPAGAAEGFLPGNPAPEEARLPQGPPVDSSQRPPCSILEKFWPAHADPLRAHYGTLLPSFHRVYAGHEVTRFSELLTLSEGERPLLVVGVMRNYAPELVVLWGPSQHLDPP
jgi:hypothetical protein